MAADPKKPGGLLVAIGLGKKPPADGDAAAEIGDDYEPDEGVVEAAGEVRRALKGDDDAELGRALCNLIDVHAASKRAPKDEG